MIRSLLFYSIILTLFAFTALNWVKPKHVKHKKLSLPDNIIEDVVDSRFDKTGALVTEITTKKLVHDPVSKSDRYQHPIIKRYKRGAPPWVLQARKGYSDSKRDKFYFENHVTITQIAYANNPSTLIETNFLEYSIPDNTAITDRPVRLKQDILSIKSVGARIDLKRHEFKLLNQAEGFYG